MTTDPTFSDPQRAHYDEICRIAAEVGKLAVIHERAKERAKKAKADYDEKVSALCETITRGPALFDKHAPEDWRATALADIDGFPAGAAKALAEQEEITTLGQLVEWNDNGSTLEQVKGIGEPTAEKARDALTAFWDANPELCKEYVVDEEAEGTEDDD